MKKFLITAIVIMLVMLGVYYVVYYEGWLYVETDKPLNMIAVVDEEYIYLVNENGERVPFQVKGVVMPSSVPGANDSDFNIDEATWIRWFGYIQNMGANTIRIHNIYSADFYDALYMYNTNHEEPLYLLQGIQVTDYANKSAEDAYGEEFYEYLVVEGKRMVDVIHGEREIFSDGIIGEAVYKNDVSPWVLGYQIGENWESDVIAYTNANEDYDSVYEGTYFTTREDATVFEAMLAELMDTIIAYEMRKYSEQRLISFANAPHNDPFEYDVFYGRQIGKYSCLDAEHILPNKEKFQGYYAAYQLYQYCPGYTEYFSDEQKQELDTIIEQLNKEYFCEGYTQLLAEYHTMPVVIMSYGFSTSRGTDGVEGRYSETQQGFRAIETYKDVVNSGCAGAFISSWQDSWDRVSWNTSYSVDLLGKSQWHDMQSIAQNYGIMAFETGKKENHCYVDGRIEEWKNAKEIIKDKEYSLYASYDEAYVYFMVQGENVSEDNVLYIPIDTTKESGSTKCETPNLTFGRAADFLLCINGKRESRLLVQERYDSLRQNYLEQITGENPFEIYPEKNSSKFVPVRMLLSNLDLVTPDMSEQEQEDLLYRDAMETGTLTYGNANPDSYAYYSLADFCYGEECVEIRIPWNLFNFSDPSDMQIHRDYYEHYGREDQKISSMYIGLGDEKLSETIEMEHVPLRGWPGVSEYRERLKDSYYIIQKEWRE